MGYFGYAIIFKTKSGNLIHISAHEVGQTDASLLFNWSEHAAERLVKTYNENKKYFVFKSLNYKATYMSYKEFKLANKKENPFFKTINADGNGFSIKENTDLNLNNL